MVNPKSARSRVQLLASPLLGNNPGQVVHTPQQVGAFPQFGGPAD